MFKNTTKETAVNLMTDHIASEIDKTLGKYIKAIEFLSLFSPLPVPEPIKKVSE